MDIKKYIFVLFAIISLISCSNLHKVVPSAGGTEPYAGVINCETPYKLVYGCELNFFTGGVTNLKANIDGEKFKFSSTADGKTIYIKESFGEDFTRGLVKGYSLGLIDTQINGLNDIYEKVKAKLSDNNISILETIPRIPSPRGLIGTNKIVIGYILKLDGNGYLILEQYIY